MSFVKLKEEIVELEEAIGKSNKQEIESEFGDVLFTAVNMARHLNVDPELALEELTGDSKIGLNGLKTSWVKTGNLFQIKILTT